MKPKMFFKELYQVRQEQRKHKMTKGIWTPKIVWLRKLVGGKLKLLHTDKGGLQVWNQEPGDQS